MGTILTIPARDAVAAIDSGRGRPAGARAAWRRSLRQPSPAGGGRRAGPAQAARRGRRRGREEAARRYREGLGLERRGDDQGALAAFLEAGEAGYGLAQRKLGQIYDKGNTAVQRDYQASLKWYQKAREQGVEIDKPLPRIDATVSGRRARRSATSALVLPRSASR